jgi:hypothetical protein
MDKDQIIERLVRDVMKSWGPEDLESFAREQLTIFYMDNPDELIEDSAVFKIDDKLEEKPPHWWNASQ